MAKKSEAKSEEVKKTPVKVKPVRNAIADKIVAGINKQFKRPVVARCSDILEDLKITFIPTPSLKLNNMLNGGIARGKIAEIFGPTGSGKTTLCYQIIGKDMTEHSDNIWGWLESEHSFDPEIATHYGIDTDRLIFWEVTEDGAEAALDVLDGIITQAGSDISGIVVNSVAALTPKSELVNEIGKADMGVQAKMMSKLMRKITAKCGKSKCPVIFINQVRDSMSLYGGQVTTGGKALSFFASQRIEMRKVKAEASDGVKETEYIKIKCKTRKNRFAKKNPYLETEIFGRYGYGIDVSMEVLQLAIDAGILEKNGGGNYRYVASDGKEYKWRGAATVMQFIDENKWFVDEVSSKLDASAHVNSMSEEEIAATERENERIAQEFSDIEDTNDVEATDGEQ